MEKTTRHPGGLARAILRRCLGPLISVILLAAFYSAYLTRVRHSFAINWNAIADKAFFVVAIIVLAYWARTIVIALFNWYATRFAGRTRSDLDDAFLPLFRRIASILIWLIALIAVLSYLGININALIATLGVGSLAIALAAQDTIANIISGFLIMIDRPFRVGDEVKLATGEQAIVTSIGIRRSVFRGSDGSTLFVPNIDLAKSRIVNLSMKG